MYACILLKELQQLQGVNVVSKRANQRNKHVIFTNFARIIKNCLSKVYNTKLDNAKDVDVLVPMYESMKYCHNYSNIPCIITSSTGKNCYDLWKKPFWSASKKWRKNIRLNSKEDTISCLLHFHYFKEHFKMRAKIASAWCWSKIKTTN